MPRLSSFNGSDFMQGANSNVPSFLGEPQIIPIQGLLGSAVVSVPKLCCNNRRNLGALDPLPHDIPVNGHWESHRAVTVGVRFRRPLREPGLHRVILQYAQPPIVVTAEYVIG